MGAASTCSAFAVVKMLSYDDVASLLALQSRAYALLMWLAGEAMHDTSLLPPHTAAMLHKPDEAARWIKSHHERIPPALVPDEVGGAFANLFASFFATSFHVSHFEFNGHIVESRLKVGAGEGAQSHLSVERCAALALRHLAGVEKLLLDDNDARRLVRRKGLRQPALMWAYVWELDRRARRKGKGPVVRDIWRALPIETRKSLDTDKVWAAREELLVATRAHFAS